MTFLIYNVIFMMIWWVAYKAFRASCGDWMVIIQELIEKVSKNELSKLDYPCLNDPSPTFHGTTYAVPVTHNPPAHSMRSRRTPTWARPRGSDDGYSRFYFLSSSIHVSLMWWALLMKSVSYFFFSLHLWTLFCLCHCLIILPNFWAVYLCCILASVCYYR